MNVCKMQELNIKCLVRYTSTTEMEDIRGRQWTRHIRGTGILEGGKLGMALIYAAGNAVWGNALFTGDRSHRSDGQ